MTSHTNEASLQSNQPAVVDRHGCLFAVGIVCLDIVNTVTDFPSEDTAVRATDSTQSRGGNAANMASVFAGFEQTAPAVAFVGSISSDSAAAFVTEDLQRRGVGMDGVEVFDGADYCLPTSYVTLSQSTGSRTIVHRRVLPELTMDGFIEALRKNPEPSWLHFEGRNVDTLVDMMSHARLHTDNAIISVEIEKVSLESPERLTRLADFCFFSKEFVLSHTENELETLTPEKFMNRQFEDGRVDTYAATIVCPFGDKGVYAMAAADRCLLHVPAWIPETVVDSLGAGDTFIGASIFALLRLQMDLGTAMAFGCEVAGRKCGQKGLEVDIVRERMTKFTGGSFWKKNAGRWEKHIGSVPAPDNSAASCIVQ